MPHGEADPVFGGRGWCVVGVSFSALAWGRVGWFGWARFRV